MPRNPTEAQIEASRRNGAHSKGPVTPDGKRVVSQNARKLSVSPRHLAASLLLPGESSDALESLVKSILEEHPPANEIELGYVNMAVAAQWRLRRIHAAEQASLIAAAAANPTSNALNAPDGRWEIPAAQVAEAFKQVHGAKGYGSIFQIAEGRYGRQYTHALKQLRELQAGRESVPELDYSQSTPKSYCLGVPDEIFFHDSEPENSQYSLNLQAENKPEEPEKLPPDPA